LPEGNAHLSQFNGEPNRSSFGTVTALWLPRTRHARFGRLLVLFFVLVVVWLLAWAAFHIAGGMVHLLLIIAIASLVIHFLRGRRVA
jgi:hypothetical protein